MMDELNTPTQIGLSSCYMGVRRRAKVPSIDEGSTPLDPKKVDKVCGLKFIPTVKHVFFFFLVAVRRTLKSGISPEDMEKLTKQVNILDSK